MEQSAYKIKIMLKECPDDGTVKILIDRCKEFQKNPPPKSWVGEQILKLNNNTWDDKRK